MDWVHQRIKEIREAGMRIDQEVAKKYMLGEPEPLPGLKPVKIIEMDPLTLISKYRRGISRLHDPHLP